VIHRSSTSARIELAPRHQRRPALPRRPVRR
jgi:hypothetical protein